MDEKISFSSHDNGLDITDFIIDDDLHNNGIFENDDNGNMSVDNAISTDVVNANNRNLKSVDRKRNSATTNINGGSGMESFSDSVPTVNEVRKQSNATNINGGSGMESFSGYAPIVNEVRKQSNATNINGGSGMESFSGSAPTVNEVGTGSQATNINGGIGMESFSGSVGNVNEVENGSQVTNINGGSFEDGFQNEVGTPDNSGNENLITEGSSELADMSSQLISEIVDVGDNIFGKYMITKRINVQSGEADIFLCESDNEWYIAKLYRRADALNFELFETLKSINCEYVAKPVETGYFNGCFTEILHYYKNGSVSELKGKLSYPTLRKYVIDLNEALHALHEKGIIHKDLKPSNIMLSDDKEHVVIIDFGISSVVKEPNSVIESRGFTAEFSAPETFKGLFWEGVDYYSLGITLYALYYGKTPYEDKEELEVSRLQALNKLDFPGDIDIRLKSLILALTYADITNRNDEESQNKRWTYKEVRKWIKGVYQPVPPVSNATFIKIPEINLAGLRYTNLENLILGLNRNWEAGKKIVFSGILANQLMSSNPEIAEVLEKTANSVGSEDDDILYFSNLYRMSPDMRYFLWKGHAYKDLAAFGTIILDAFRDGGGFKSPMLREMLTKGVFSKYIDVTEGTGSVRYSPLIAVEDKYQRAVIEENERAIQISLFQLAYMLSDDVSLVYRRIFRKKGNTGIPVDVVFKTPRDLLNYVSNINSDYRVTQKEKDDFFAFLGLNSERNELSPVVTVWAEKRADLNEILKKLH